MCDKATTQLDKWSTGEVTPPKINPPGINKIIRLDAMPGLAAVQPMKMLKMPIVIAMKSCMNKNSNIRPEKTRSPQILKTAIPRKSEQYGTSRPIKSHGVPFKRVGSYCFVRRRRGIIPIVAKVKNIEPKKNKNPCVCAFEVEPAGLNKTRLFKVSPELSPLPENIALSIATISGKASLMSAVCAVFVLS